MFPTLRVKICCIASAAEARLAIRYGASALGFVSAMPSGPGPIDEALIADIARTVPPPIATFLLTCAADPDAIIAQQRRCGTNTLQLVDTVDSTAYPVIRRALPGVRIVQVIHVAGAVSVTEAEAVAPHVDAILLDSGNPALAVKVLGGTGRTHDWLVSRQIRDRVPVPVFLAGGLRAHNIEAAIDAVHPFGIDLCTGVRTDGALDESKLAGFMENLARAATGPHRAWHH